MEDGTTQSGNSENYNLDSKNYETKYKKEIETNTVNCSLTKANTWLVDYINTYSYETNTSSDTQESAEENTDTFDYKNVDNIDESNRESSTLAKNFLQEQIIFVKDEIKKKKDQEQLPTVPNADRTQPTNTEPEVTGKIYALQYVNSTRIVGLNKKTITTTTTNKYTQGTPETKLKTDADSETPNFITLLNKYSSARSSLYELSSWLFSSFEKDEDTADMIDLTKYLFNVQTNSNKYGDINEDDILDWIEKASFTSVSGSSAFEFTKAYIHSWERVSGVSSDGKRYIVKDDGYGNLAVGHGLDIYNSGYLEVLKAACGGVITEGTEIDIEVVEAIEDEILENNTNSVKSIVQSLDLTGYQIAALVSRSYNCGVAGALTYKRGTPALDFVASYNKYWRDSHDLYEKGKTEANYNHNLYSQYMAYPVTSNGAYSLGLERRRKSEWTLFQTGYADTINESYSNNGSSSIIEIADAIDKYMAQNNYKYSLNVNELATTFEKSKSYKATCCATYVSWVLQEAGYISEAGHVNNVSGIDRALTSAGWKKITSYEDLQPGDVMIQGNKNVTVRGHTQIFAGKATNGNIKIYSAGYDGEIQIGGPTVVAESYQKSKFNWGYRPNN